MESSSTHASPIALRQVAVGFLLAAASAFTASNPPISPVTTDVPLAEAVRKRNGRLRSRLFFGAYSPCFNAERGSCTTAGYSAGSAKTATWEVVRHPCVLFWLAVTNNRDA